MVLRLTSPNTAEPQDENVSRPHERDRVPQDSPEPIKEGVAGPRDRRADTKVVAADLARDLVLQEIVEQARLTTMATGAFIGLARGHKLLGPATSGSNAGEFVAYLNRDRRSVDSCFRAGAAQYCRDSETSDELEGSKCRYLGARSIILIPILGEEEKKLGIFGVFSPHVDAFADANLVALQSLTQRISDAIVKIERSASVSSGEASALLQSSAGKPLSIRANPLRGALRPLAAIGPALWGFGILAVLLLVGWTVSRAIGQRTPPAPAAVSAPPSSLSAQPVSDQSSSESVSGPGGAKTNSEQTPAAGTGDKAAVKQDVKSEGSVVTAAAKPSPTVALGIKKPSPARVDSKSGKKISAGPQAQVPDLEIENALDDASFEAVPPSHGNTSKVPPANSATPRSTQPANKASTVNSNSPPLPTASLASTPREAVRITRAPEPSAAASPSSSDADKSGGNSDFSAPPVKLQEWSALAHVAKRVQADYPPDAKAQGTQGTVVLNIVVGPDGRVQDVTPVDGDHPFVESAVKAMHQWRFTPFLRNGQAARFESQITFKFVLP